MELRHVFGRAIRLLRERTQGSPATFAHWRVLIEHATDRLVFSPTTGPEERAPPPPEALPSPPRRPVHLPLPRQRRADQQLLRAGSAADGDPPRGHRRLLLGPRCRGLRDPHHRPDDRPPVRRQPPRRPARRRRPLAASGRRAAPRPDRPPARAGGARRRGPSRVACSASAQQKSPPPTRRRAGTASAACPEGPRRL
jgi:hypothetical protein